MSKDAHSLLARLEIRFNKGDVSSENYKSEKWEILQELHRHRKTIKPIFRDQRKRKLQDSLGIWYNYIPASPFIFGPENEYAELKAGIYMATYPVTVSEFRNFLENSGWDYPETDLEKMSQVCPDPNCPVSYVSWNDAKEYCRWLRKETKEYYSLPNEYEWEIAARGIDGRLYPWGYKKPDVDSACFQGEKRYYGTVPVNSFTDNQSPFGCMDLVGNVWEWCLDGLDDPRDPHILRGGSWRNDREHANCISQSYGYPPEKRIDYGGFRVIYLPEDMLYDYRHTDDDLEAPEKQMRIGYHPLNTAEISSNPSNVSVAPPSRDFLIEPTREEMKPEDLVLKPLPGSSAMANESKLEVIVDDVLPISELETIAAAPPTQKSNASTAPKASKHLIQEQKSSQKVANYDDLVLNDPVQQSSNDAPGLSKSAPTVKGRLKDKLDPEKQKISSTDHIPRQHHIKSTNKLKQKVKDSKSSNDIQAEIDQIVSAGENAQDQHQPTRKSVLYAMYGLWSVLLLAVVVLFFYKVLSL